MHVHVTRSPCCTVEKKNCIGEITIKKEKKKKNTYLKKNFLLFFFSWLDGLFHFSAAEYSIVWIHHSLSIHSPTERHFGCFQFWQLWINFYRHPCVGFSVDISFPLLWLSRGTVAGLEVKSIFSFIRNCQTVFQSSCAVLHPYQQWMRVPLAPHPHQHLVLSVFCILNILIGM